MRSIEVSDWGVGRGGGRDRDRGRGCGRGRKAGEWPTLKNLSSL